MEIILAPVLESLIHQPFVDPFLDALTGPPPAGALSAQEGAPVPNSIPWSTYLAILGAGAAVFTTSFHRKISWLVDREHMNPRWELWGTIILCFVCGVVGGLVGWRAWDAILGGAAAFTGSGAAPFVMRLLEPVLVRFARMKERNGGNDGPGKQSQ